MQNYYVLHASNISMYIDESTITFCKQLKLDNRNIPFTRSLSVEDYTDFINYYSKFISCDIHKRYRDFTDHILYKNVYSIMFGSRIDPNYPDIVDLDGFLVDGDIFRKLIMMYNDIK